jgi:hypothetical protein
MPVYPLRIVRSSLTVLIGCLPVFAQSGAGSIHGTVVLPGGARVSVIVRLFLPKGESPVAQVTTASNGSYSFAEIRPDFYDLTFEASGFARLTLRNIKVDPDRPAIVEPQRLQPGELTPLGPAGATVREPAGPPVAAAAAVEQQYPPGIGSRAELPESSSEQSLSQDLSAEAAFTVSDAQVRGLPLLDRNPMRLLLTQPGIISTATVTGQRTTVVNGLRPSFSNMTLDGVNIQRNYVRGDALESDSNRLFLDQIYELTIVTSNAGATAPAGAAQVVFVTPSGTNSLHGSAYWYHRNNALSANGFTNNQAGIRNPVFNQNQWGATAGGPIRKDRLLFYANFESYLRRNEIARPRTVPADAAREGWFQYRAGTEIRRVNVLELTGSRINPVMSRILSLVPRPQFAAPAAGTGDNLNAVGTTILQRNDLRREHATLKLDWNASLAHALSGTFLWMNESTDRPFLSNNFERVPAVYNHNIRRVATFAWRWSVSGRVINDFRSGFNNAPADFFIRPEADAPNVAPLMDLTTGRAFFTDPINRFREQTRTDDNITLQDNVSFIRAKHFIQAGWYLQRFRTRFYDARSSLTHFLNVAGEPPFTAADFPGITPAAFANAVNYWGMLTGRVFLTSQGAYAGDGADYVPGAPLRGRLKFNQQSWYLQDAWRLHPRLTLTAGLRYDLFGVPRSLDRRLVSPRIDGAGALPTLWSDAVLDFTTGDIGYRQDNNNLAPHFAIAWDALGNRRWLVRAGYSVHYVNDEHVRSAEAALESNPGLGITLSQAWPPGVTLDSVPPLPGRRIEFPRSVSQLLPASVGMIDPNLRTPYVQQWTAAVEHEIARFVIGVRYLGNRALKQFLRLDVNQIDVRAGGFLEDFRRAQRNLQLTGMINPGQPCAGCEPLQVIPALRGARVLGPATIAQAVQLGSAGELAYQFFRAGDSFFMPNPYTSAAYLTANFGASSWNALQIDVNRRLHTGLLLQGNYMLGKLLTNTGEWGDLDASRLEARVDAFNGEIARSRASYDITHAFKLNWVYDLPLARGLRTANRILYAAAAGWKVSGIVITQSGSPFSVVSGRATFNRLALSARNTANSTLTKEQLEQRLAFEVDGYGPVAGKALVPGRDVVHPHAGTIGMLQPRMFSGPWIHNLDLALVKSTRIHEMHAIEFRCEVQNAFNRTNWLVGNQFLDAPNLPSTQMPGFGRNIAAAGGPREIQLGLIYRF